MIAGESISGSVGRNILKALDIKGDSEILHSFGAELHTFVALLEECVEIVYVKETLQKAQERTGKFPATKFSSDNMFKVYGKPLFLFRHMNVVLLGCMLT